MEERKPQTSSLDNFLANFIGRISVGKKLMLIYLFDLSAVVFIISLLINQAYINIDFSKKEINGVVYIDVIRDSLMTLGSSREGQAPERAQLEELGKRIVEVDGRLGDEMSAHEASAAYLSSLNAFARFQGNDPDAWQRAFQGAITTGRSLLTRVNNQSNLILDPDLDSYYSMSLYTLRFPDLLTRVKDITHHMAAMNSLRGEARGRAVTQYLILEGKLDAIAKDISADYDEAKKASSSVAFTRSMEASQRALLTELDGFRDRLKTIADSPVPLVLGDGLGKAELNLLQLTRQTWTTVGRELDVLLKARVDRLIHSIVTHLLTTLAMLAVILTLVYLVARQISSPLRQLARVADAVRQTNDYSLRASWNGKDEIGKLVASFNTMLEELDRVRVREQELRASAAQHELVETMPIALMVTALDDHRVLHANQQAVSWLGGISRDPWSKLVASVRDSFLERLKQGDEINEFEVSWQIGGAPQWAVLSARRLRYAGEDAMLTVLSPINQVKQMEQRLIESEKMASLGELVAGVAHEINTPVGIGVTAASSFDDSVEQLEAVYRAGKMKKSDLEDFIQVSKESSQMILRNLQRAAELIQSFKQVAVDQSSEAHRKFNIKNYMEEIVQSIGAKLRKSRMTCHLDVADDLEITNNAGAFAQIATNLIMNAIIHAYPDGEEGVIHITGKREKGSIQLAFADEGSGIPEHIVGKIFDPFFTTNRGNGGSGLGLSIVYNLVTQTLNGTIECASKVGIGTSFVVRI